MASRAAAKRALQSSARLACMTRRHHVLLPTGPPEETERAAIDQARNETGQDGWRVVRQEVVNAPSREKMLGAPRDRMVRVLLEAD